jgi:hypothetical protein
MNPGGQLLGRGSWIVGQVTTQKASDQRAIGNSTLDELPFFVVASSRHNCQLLPNEGLTLAFMAANTAGAGVISLVTVDAAAHGGNVRRFRGDLHLANVSVAHLAFQFCFQVRVMTPVNERRHGIDTDPRNPLFLPCKLRKVLDCGFVLGDFTMTAHTFS